MGETTEYKWWETARPGDRFGRGQKSRPFIVVEPWDGERLRAYDFGAVWLRVDDLRPCAPLHAENLRRHMAGVAEATGEVKNHLGIILRQDDGKWCGYNWDWLEPQHYDSAIGAAQEVIPDDWHPPGGGS